MARLFTLGEIYDRLEKVTDSEGDTHLSATEKREAINSGLAETWDIIVASGLGEKYVKSASFTSVANTMEYSLAAAVGTDGDFYRIHQLYTVETGSMLRPLTRLNPSELWGFKAPTQAISLKLYYIPCAPEPDPTDQTAWRAITFDGINGWEELVIMCAAFHIKAKKDDAYNPYAQRKQELIRRIGMMGNVDFGDAPRVNRKRGRRSDWTPYQNPINGYGVRGDKLELYYFDGVFQ